ncbi:MAG: rod shape-determining protein [Clostridia bacterium]|nr:rod shape-determining protein [Clostridia bacterium]
MGKIELAIKFGSNEIIVYRKGLGIVAKQSSYVATSKSGGKICAYGNDAKHLCNLKGSQYQLHQPIQGIDIINTKLAGALISNVINKAIFESGIITAIVAVPCALTEKKLLELKVLLHNAGIANMTFVQNSVCIRTNLNSFDDNAEVMVVDMGKYLTDISVLTKYEFNMGRNYLIGGVEMDKALATYVEDNYNVKITEEQAESIKKEIASLYDNDMYTCDFEGIDSNNGYKNITIRANEVRVAVIGVYEKIFDLIEETLESLPLPSCAEVRKNGIVFTGGVSSIIGFTEYASKRLHLPVYVVDNPKDAVILGAGKLLSINKEDYPHIKL